MIPAPCPFCGKRPRSGEDAHPGFYSATLSCKADECMVTVHVRSDGTTLDGARAKVVEVWNTRHASANVDDVTRELLREAWLDLTTWEQIGKYQIIRENAGHRSESPEQETIDHTRKLRAKILAALRGR